MISKIKKPVSILLVFMMIVSLFAAVPMTVNAAPPGASLVGRYVETPGRGASNTMVFPDCDVYIKGVAGTQTIHNTSVTYSHSTEGSYDVLRFNGKEIYRGDWAVPDGIRIVSGSGTSSDPYVTEWYSTPTITWKLDEDTVIDTTKVPFDAVPTHAAPTKEPDEDYTYTFAGWSPKPVAVTDDATYTATFTAVPRPYNVNVETAEHGTVTANPAEAAKGNQVTLTAEPDAGYALSSIKAFKKNTNSQQATLTALDGSSKGGEGYDKLVDGNTNTKWGFNGGSGYIIVKADKAFRLNDYSLTTANDTDNYSGRNWKNWGIYGANFASDSEAVKNSDQWQLVTSVTNDSKLQATNFTRYDYSVNTDPEAYQYYKIEISANKGDGYTQMSELTLSGANYDVEVVLMQDSADPAKYTFEMPASNVTVKAEFEAIPTYTVTWKNGDTTLKTDTVNKDAIPAYSGDVPTKAENEQYSYTFTGWTDSSNTFYSKDSNLPPVTKDETYTATYTETAKPLPDVIKDCTYTRDTVVFANVPFIQPGDFSTLVDGAINFVSLAGGFALFDAKDYSYKFYDKNGTEIAATLSKEQSFPGSAVGLSDDVTIYNKEYQLSNTELDKYYIVATAPVEIFTGHTITLGGDIGVNFYLDSAVLDTYTGTKTVKFTVDGEETTVAVPATPTDDGYKVTRNVVAAQMAHTITATLYVGNEAVDTDEYSVREYAEDIYYNPTAYDKKNKPDELKALAYALLNYGAMAQTVFDGNLHEKPALANKTVGAWSIDDYAAVTADEVAGKIKGSASDLNDVATLLGAKFYTSSLIYLSKNTLRLYFTPTSYPGEIPNSDAYGGNLSGYYYYVDHKDIAAAELDNQQTFNVNGTEFTFSALDYVKAVIGSNSMSGTQKNLAKSLFLYNQAANDYFDEPAPAQNIVDLDGVTEDTTVEDGYTITGTLKGDYKISIADGATVTLKNADITCLTGNATFAAITPLGNATIILEGNNTVMGPLNNNYNAIFVPENTTLTIEGDGSLTASAAKVENETYYHWATAIGAGTNQKAGNIVINSGNITAISGNYCAAIGGSQGYNGGCGDITINGGTVTATCTGSSAAGIGSGAYSTSCGNITINGGTVTATGGSYAPAIGSGAYGSSCGNITISANVTSVTATKGSGASKSIGAGSYGSSCGTVSIADPSKVTQN